MENVFAGIPKFTLVTIKGIQLNHIFGSNIAIIPISVTHMFQSSVFRYSNFHTII